MKILILSSAFPPHIYGGGEIAAYNMACLLVKRGHEVHVATMKEKAEQEARGERSPEGFFLHRIAFPRHYTLYGRTIEKSPIHKILWHLQDYFDPRNRTIMHDLLDRVRPDQVDVHNISGFGYNALQEIGRCTLPVKVYLHGLDLVCFRASMFKNGRNCTTPCGMCRPIGGLRQACAKKAGRIAFIAPSQTPVERMAPFVPLLSQSPIAIIKNVSDSLSALPAYRAGDALRLVYAGRFDPVKGVSFLLSVLDPLAKQFDFCLDLYGTGPLENELRNQYQNKTWVKFHGFVSREEVARATAQADLFCMPSLWSEIYGLVTAQALYLGTPVIGSKIGGTSTLVRDGVTGLLVEAGNLSAWSEAFTSLFSDRKKLAGLREGAERHKEEFSEAAIAEQYEAFSATLVQDVP